MSQPKAVLAIVLSMFVVLQGEAPATREPGGAPVPLRLAALPLLFEDGPDGPVTRARGLTMGIRPDGVAMETGDRTVRLAFAGAANAAIGMELPQAARINRLVGPRDAWRTGIPTFGRVRLSGLYNGVDAVFYGTDRQLEYDVIVAPGTSPNAIAIDVHGADHLAIDGSGRLLITIADRTIVQERPVAYQERSGSRDVVDARFVVEGSRVRFDVGPYDRGRTLIIDPIISYSSYLGTAGQDRLEDVAVDSNGNVLVAGSAGAGQFPIASVRARTVPQGDDPFIAKLAPDGSPIWLTFLGGSGRDAASDVAIGPGNDVFVAGWTQSTDFPVTPGAFDTTPGLSNGVNEADGFVARLSPDGTVLRYGTYIGGSFREQLHVLDVDAAGRAHVGGQTESTDFPVTMGGQGRARADSPDGFIARVSPTGSALEMSRVIPGNNADVVRGIAVDAVGDIDLAGYTTSDVFPIVNAIRGTKFGPGDPQGEFGWDGFVMRVTAGGELRFSTYVGGMGEDYVIDLARGPDGTIYIAAESNSDAFTGTTNARPSAGSDGSDMVVLRLEDNGMRTMNGRYVGGRAFDAAMDLTIDRHGLVWLAGMTTSSDFPTTASFPASPRGVIDVAVAQLSADLWELHLAGAFGGSQIDAAYGVAIDPRGHAWLVGDTGSLDYPVVDAIQATKKGASSLDRDATITTIACDVSNAGYTPHRTVVAAGGTGTVTIAMDPGCALAPVATVDWLHVTEIGVDRIHYTVDPNPGATSRTGWIMIEPDWGHRVTQLGTAAPPTVNPREIVLNAADATTVRGSWFFDTDPSDTHFMLVQRDRGRPKATRPEIVPVDYFEMEFYAEAGRPYRLWLLGLARPQHWANDSVHVQFSDSVDASGAPIYRIGTRSSAEINLEDCAGCGVPGGLSWEDNGWGSRGALGPTIRFARTGRQRLWVQTREDGLSVGQIVLSAERYLTTPPPESEWVSVPQRTEIVLRARDAVRLSGAWRFAADTTAARGERLWHPDAGAAKVNAPLANPQHFVDFTFDAEAGRAYRVWVRLTAERNYWGNDSVWLQLSDSVDAAGAAIARIGSAAGLDVNLEECSGCGIDGWGWRDNGWGASPAPRGTLVYFASSGSHTLRVQTREDGVSIDQIVISADAYLHAAPGPPKRDRTIFE